MKTAMLAPGPALIALLFALAGCDRPAPSPTNATAPAPAATTDYLARIKALPEKQRDAVFYRALDDAGSDCQEVTGSAARDPIQGQPAWTVHCGDKRDFVAVLTTDGMIQVAGTPAPGTTKAP
jgi:hypothetical protein